MTGLPQQGSRKGQEESGKQNHQWAKKRVCYTYETSLETQAQSDKALECHISSKGQKYQQLWLRLKYGAQRINVFFKARVTECKKPWSLDEVGLTRADVNMDRTMEEKPVQNLIPTEVSV